MKKGCHPASEVEHADLGEKKKRRNCGKGIMRLVTPNN